ncbi:MAG: DNA starvation/stationary phase protection protein [Rhodobacteraceae bacterium]|nr:DNA starvation/stationary phase protection protein [Paracoccaceae bacterium]
MSDALDVVPEKHNVETGVANTAKLAKKLEGILADTYRLVFKTHAYHWCVEGPLFYAVHNLTESQYQDMFAAADVLAERMRALGHLTPMRFDQMASKSSIKDRGGELPAGAMIADLMDDHEAMAARLHDLAALAAENKDIVTEDLAVARSAFHEKAAWMLRSLAAS